MVIFLLHLFIIFLINEFLINNDLNFLKKFSKLYNIVFSSLLEDIQGRKYKSGHSMLLKFIITVGKDKPTQNLTIWYSYLNPFKNHKPIICRKLKNKHFLYLEEPLGPTQSLGTIYPISDKFNQPIAQRWKHTVV